MLPWPPTFGHYGKVCMLHELLFISEPKGPCDCVDCSTKWSTDDAVKRGSMIVCVQDFFSLAETEGIVIHYVFISNEDLIHAC